MREMGDLHGAFYGKSKSLTDGVSINIKIHFIDFLRHSPCVCLAADL